MSRGDERRRVDLENLEAAFLEALARAREAPRSAFIAEHQGRRRGGASDLDVELFTLQSKIDRLRAKLGLEPFEVPLARAPVSRAAAWPAPPEVGGTAFALDLAGFQAELAESGRDPEALFAQAGYAGPKRRQGGDQPSWRLARIEVGTGRAPARLTLTVFPLPEHPDVDGARERLEQALDKVVRFCESARTAPAAERPRALQIGYLRRTRELSLQAR